MRHCLLRKSIPFFCLALLATGTGYARTYGGGSITSVRPGQVNGPVKGQVTSEKGEPLPGVTVLVKGTTTGTATDGSGRYSLNAPDNAILVFSFIGFNARAPNRWKRWSSSATAPSGKAT
jgi:TonB-dependent starch-binding outer membrane protein SusC